MRALLIRHAVTPETGTKLTGRLPGVDLSSDGVGAAEALGSALADLRIDAFYTSPIARCRQTADLVARPHGLTPKTLHAVIEADYGAWSGRSLRSLSKLKAWQALMAAASRFRFPEGESLRDVQYRAVGAIEQLAARHRTGTVAVVSHADVIRCILAHYLGMPLDLIHRLHVAPTSVSELVMDGEGPARITAMNATIGLVVR